MVRNLLKVSDFSKAECERVINKAIEIKKSAKNFSTLLEGETLLMLFEKPSLRTRISFETGMQQLGGHAIFYSIQDSPLGKKENISDTAKVASRFVNIIAARVYKRQDIWDLAKYADVPIINMLDDFAHPC
ncbi:MAG: ornithine carbamoyltransferase, partial [Candidatus Thorarchaeota archaeon]